MSWLDRARAKAHEAMSMLPGKAGELATKASEALARPLADARELADRRAFASGGAAPVAEAKPATEAKPAEVAPVIVYHMDKTRRDALRLAEILDDEGIPHQVSNIQEDAAAQFAVKRDSGSHRMLVVFIASEVIGVRAELVKLQNRGSQQRSALAQGRAPRRPRGLRRHVGCLLSAARIRPR